MTEKQSLRAKALEIAVLMRGPHQPDWGYDLNPKLITALKPFVQEIEKFITEADPDQT